VQAVDDFWLERMKAIRVRLSRTDGLKQADLDRLKLELDAIERASRSPNPAN
jgi:hypothetical protein